MVQPKYSPEEALNRVKLLMSYDSSKTLTENIKSNKLLEQWYVDEPDTPVELSVVKILEGCPPKRQPGTIEAVKIATAFNTAFNLQSWYTLGTGTDDTYWKAQLEILKNGNYNDLCNVKFEFENYGFGNFAKKLVEELDDSELSTLMETFALMKSKSDTASEVPVTSTEYMNISYYQQNFECIFRTAGVITDKTVYSDENNYSYVIIIGKKGKYRLYYDGRVTNIDGTKTGKKLICDERDTPKFINESVKKKSLFEQLDDSSLDGKDNGISGEEDINQEEECISGEEDCTDGNESTSGQESTSGSNNQKREIYPLEAGSYWTPGDPYQYRVRNNEWETKSWKTARIIIPDWKSLKDNITATNELDRRHKYARKTGESGYTPNITPPVQPSPPNIESEVIVVNPNEQ